jgi:hypothetical protein
VPPTGLEQASEIGGLILCPRYLRVNCRVGPAQAGAYARWFCGVTLVDARQSVYASVNYALPIARGSWLGGWEISGINSMRTGLPLTVTVSRKSTDLPGRQQQLAAARPDSKRIASAGHWTPLQP